MSVEFKNIVTEILFSPTTWLLFFLIVMSPILSMHIVRDLSNALGARSILIQEKEKKLWRKFLRTIFFAMCIIFLFFHLYIRLFNA